MANPKSELLEWLALKPRTQGWGAVVAYDRNKCNALLLQDYINKFSTDRYEEPINEAVAMGDNYWTHLHDWVTDVPRLSFEDSSLGPGGEVNLRMAIVGGTQVSIDNSPGYKRAIAVKSIDALEHPELIAEHVSLSKTAGTVDNETGKVVLDLGDPETAKGNWELTFANTQHDRRKGGAFFKKHYNEADPIKRLYHLGTIGYTDQQYLKPSSFKLRTMTATGANIRSAENFGDGTVELFICMEGDQEGGTPPVDDWKNLIPDQADGEEATDAAVLISHSLIMKHIIIPNVLEAFKTDPSQIKQTVDPAGFISIEGLPGKGHMSLTMGSATENYRLRFYDVKVPLVFEDKFRFTLTRPTAEGLRIRIGGDFEISENGTMQVEGISNEEKYVAVLTTALATTGHYNIEVDPVANKLFLVSGEMETAAGIRTLTHGIPSEVTNYLQQGDGQVRTVIREQMAAGVASILKKFHEIDSFVLHSILFNDGAGVKLKAGHFPGDVAIFGQISNLFTITPQEHLMGHGATHTFKVSQDFTGQVKWSVDIIPGSTGGIGEIDADSGLYTAPALADIHGTFTRVKVTATDPATSHSSSALVTVVVRDITVNPVVQWCNASTDEGPSTRTLSAQTLGAGILQWKVKVGDGSLPSNGDANGDNTYTAPLIDRGLEGSFTIEEIEVKNLATVKTQSAYVVVNHYQPEVKIVIQMEQSSFPDGKAQLKLLSNRDKDVEAIWTVAAGNGNIDSNGLYTGDPAGQQRFALITAQDKYDSSRDAWIILPWPLFELPDKPADNLLVD